jgi:hypothetical protein
VIKVCNDCGASACAAIAPYGINAMRREINGRVAALAAMYAGLACGLLPFLSRWRNEASSTLQELSDPNKKPRYGSGAF